jgi:hypothetical protein
VLARNFRQRTHIFCKTSGLSGFSTNWEAPQAAHSTRGTGEIHRTPQAGEGSEQHPLTLLEVAALFPRFLREIPSPSGAGGQSDPLHPQAAGKKPVAWPATAGTPGGLTLPSNPPVCLPLAGFPSPPRDGLGLFSTARNTRSQKRGVGSRGANFAGTQPIGRSREIPPHDEIFVVHKHYLDIVPSNCGDPSRRRPHGWSALPMTLLRGPEACFLGTANLLN